MKKIVYCLVLAVMLSACGGGNRAPKSTEKGYKIGDVIMVDGELGVVFAVTTDGQHGKVVSVPETICGFDKAASWCSELGSSWRLPTRDELCIMHKHRKVINSSLSENGDTLYYITHYLDKDSDVYWMERNQVTGRWEKVYENLHLRAVASF